MQNKKELRKAHKFFSKELKRTLKNHNLALKKRSILEAKIVRLNSVIDQSQGLGSVNDGVAMKKQMNLNAASGVWIVHTREGKHVELERFTDVVKGQPEIKKISMNLPDNFPLIGPDSKKVTFDPGDLIRIHHEGDMDRGTKFLFQNVEASDPKTELQYRYALGKLGLGPVVDVEKEFLLVDGIFRKAS